MTVVLVCLVAFFFALNFLHFARGMFSGDKGRSLCKTERAIVHVEHDGPAVQALVEMTHDADHRHRGIHCLQEHTEWLQENGERMARDMERVQREVERAQREVERAQRKMERVRVEKIEADLEQLQKLGHLEELSQLKEIDVLLQDANHTLHFIQ